MYVYLLEFKDGNLKIGVSGEPEVRIKSVECNCGRIVIRKWFSQDCYNATKIESKILKDFNQYQTRGEFFFGIQFDTIVTAIKNCHFEDNPTFEPSSKTVEEIFTPILKRFGRLNVTETNKICAHALNLIQQILIVGGAEWREFLQFNNAHGGNSDELFTESTEKIIEKYLLIPNGKFSFDKKSQKLDWTTARANAS